jgi:hypothetical protein
MTMHPARWILISLFLFADCVARSEITTNFIDRLAPFPPCPACQAAAKANGIPFSGIDPSASTETLAPGDSETTLITLHEKGPRTTQWLLYFQALADTNPPPAKPPDPLVIYTSTGNKFEFGNSPATIRVRTLGPFAAASELKSSRNQSVHIDKTARITVNQIYLGLGLDQATAVLHRLFKIDQSATNKITLNFGIADEPFRPSQISHDRAAAAALHVTLAEERALAGGIPALFDYFNSVQQTPDLDSILLKVVSLPSVWSLVKNVGLSPGIAIGSPRDRVGPLSLPDWALPTRSLFYALPVELTLNNHHALTVTMIVTDPHPPFLVCGGILGFLAENPDDPQNYLTLRVINARSGPD